MSRPNRKRRSRGSRPRRVFRRPKMVMAIVGGILIVGAWVFHAAGVPQYLEMLGEMERLERDIQELEQANIAVLEEIGRMEHDPLKLEELARERLGLVRKGEVVYQWIEPK